jgi:hypothetical protein
MYTIDYCCVGASYLCLCSYMSSVPMMSNVPILRMLCLRHYTAKTTEIQPLLTSKTDSAQNFGLDGM